MPSSKFRRVVSDIRPNLPDERFWNAFLVPIRHVERAFSLSLTTTVFSQRSTGWFGACPRRPTPEGLPPSLAQHRFRGASYMDTSSAFMTHVLRCYWIAWRGVD